MTPTNQDHNLESYGPENTRKPVLHEDKRIEVIVPGDRRVEIGSRGPIPAKHQYGFAQIRHNSKLRLRKLDAFALSDRALRRIRVMGCRIILIGFEDTGTVYEYHEKQFDRAVPKRYNPMSEEDPQSYVEIDKCWGKYKNHADSLIRRNDTHR